MGSWVFFGWLEYESIINAISIEEYLSIFQYISGSYRAFELVLTNRVDEVYTIILRRVLKWDSSCIVLGTGKLGLR
jgi:hypothetical protein